MHKRNTLRIFTGAYSLVRATGILETRWANRAFISSYFLYKRFWEDPFWGLIHERPGLIGDGDVLDIGANVGYTACLFAEALKPGCHVYAFEPDRTTFETLTGVVRRKNLTEKIVTVNAAVGAADGAVDFWHNKDHAGDHRVATERFKLGQPGSITVTTVPMVSVDSFVEARRLERLSLIKMDVQGYELAVCEGMTQTLARFPEARVCCEYAPESFSELGFNPADLLDFFSIRGYQAHVLTRSSITPVREQAAIQRAVAAASYVDLLFSRKESG